jgi:large conductance mechanosensitive channel
VDFKDLFLNLSGDSYTSLAAAKEAAVPVIAYGSFLNTVINFLLVAFAVFLMVKQANRLKAPIPAAAPPSTKDCPYCLNAIPLKAMRCGHCTSQLTA